MITEGPLRLLARTLTNPEIVGIDRLDDLPGATIRRR